MISPGIVSLTARFLDATGVGVSPGHQYGAIRNSLGIIQDNISPSSNPALVSLTDSGGVLFFSSPVYIVTDYLAFPGTFLTVDWSTAASPAGSPSPAFSTIHWFAPLSTTNADKNIITWALEGDTVGYEIVARVSPLASPWSPVGYTSFPFFIDESTYTPIQLNSVEYEVRRLVWDETQTLTEPVIVSPPLPISVYQTAQEYCIVTGSILGLYGEQATVDFVRFVVLEKDAPENVGTVFFTKYNEVEVVVDEYGLFAAPLVQGLTVLGEIPQIGYSKKFTVPAKPQANLSDIAAINVELYRAP